MRLRGGYTLPLQGAPTGGRLIPPRPQRLFLPLSSRRLHFSKVLVTEGAVVAKGGILAMDESRFETGLFAPAGGTVRLGTAGHLVLEEISWNSTERAGDAAQEARHGEQRLTNLGALHLFSDGHTGDLPDPRVPPRVLVVTTFTTEPFTADPLLALEGRAPDSVVRELDVLRQFFGNCRVIVSVRTGNIPQLKQMIGSARSCPWVSFLRVPARYPFDDPRLLTRGLVRSNGLSPADAVWHVRLDDAIAASEAVRTGCPPTSRLLSLAGPAAGHPVNVEVPYGYPIQDLLEIGNAMPGACIISGGSLSGTKVQDGAQRGVDIECRGLTLIPQSGTREVLPFANPGFSRASYSRSFLSALRPGFRERSTTAIRGERRPCVTCGFCEEVCPVGLLPFQLHRFTEKEMIEEAARLRLDQCIECGLCTYVCPSKRNVGIDLARARSRLADELGHAADTEVQERTA